MSEASTSAEPGTVETLCSSCEMTMTEFLWLLQDTDTARENLLEFLFKHGLLKRAIPCPKCGKDWVFAKSALEFRCWNVDHVKAKKHKKKAVQCNFRKTARDGTWFAKSQLSLQKACHITTLWLIIHTPKQELIQFETGCSANTIVDWSSYCREVCLEWAERNCEKLGGPGKVVEIDEAKIGKRKYNRGRLVEGKWIFGGIERGSNKIFIVPVPKRNSATLLEVIRQWILPGTTVISDCWKADNCLEEEGYIHETVNHSENFVDPQTGAHTQNVERMWRDVRGTIPRYGGVEDHLAGYLAEFMFRKANPSRNTLIHTFYSEISKLYSPK